MPRNSASNSSSSANMSPKRARGARPRVVAQRLTKARAVVAARAYPWARAKRPATETPSEDPSSGLPLPAATEAEPSR